MVSAQTPSDDPSLATCARRVVALTAVVGFVEVVGFVDFGGIYPGIMTGNTVQLGLNFAKSQWGKFELVALAVGVFFLGCMVASLIKRHLRRPPLELSLMALLLVVAGAIRLHPSLRIPVELPLLGFAVGLQGETIAQFGRVSLQTIVVTNNMVKFSDALIGRILPGQTPSGQPATKSDIADVLLPGLSWLTYSLAAAAGAVMAEAVRFPLLAPAFVLLLVSADLIWTSGARLTRRASVERAR